MTSFEEIKQLIYNGQVQEAIARLDKQIERQPLAPPVGPIDEAYYLRGNAYRKMGDWQRALNDYQLAIDNNPSSPALQARKMVTFSTSIIKICIISN